MAEPNVTLSLCASTRLHYTNTLYKHDNDFDMICVSLTTVDRLEDFFSAPEFTCSVRAFVDEHDSSFVYVNGEADFAFFFFVHPRISPTNH